MKLYSTYVLCIQWFSLLLFNFMFVMFCCCLVCLFNVCFGVVDFEGFLLYVLFLWLFHILAFCVLGRGRTFCFCFFNIYFNVVASVVKQSLLL